MDIRRVVGKNVRRYRIEAELSQEELAAGMGVEQGYVSRLEAGKRNPTIVEIWHVAEALGVRPAALFKRACSAFKINSKANKDRKADHPNMTAFCRHFGSDKCRINQPSRTLGSSATARHLPASLIST